MITAKPRRRPPDAEIHYHQDTQYNKRCASASVRQPLPPVRAKRRKRDAHGTTRPNKNKKQSSRSTNARCPPDIVKEMCLIDRKHLLKSKSSARMGHVTSPSPESERKRASQTANPSRRTNAGALRTLTTDTASKTDVLLHDSNTLGVNGAHVCIFKQTNEVGLAGLLQSKNRS